MKVILRHWVDIDPNIYVYFLLPRNFPYKEEEIINHPRIEKIYVEAFREQHDEKILIPREIFNLFNVDWGEKYYDVVLSDKTQVTAWIKMILESKKKEKARVPYINFAQFIAKKEGRFKTILDEYEFTCTLGWLSGYNVFQNKRHAQRCFEIAQKYLKPFWVKEIMEKSHAVNLFGVDIKRLKNFAAGNNYKAGDTFIVNYAHRMATHYNPMFVLDVVDKVFSSGEKIKLVITTPSSGTGTAVMRKLKEMMKRGMPVEIHHALPQDEFYKVASRCHLFISAIDETETANSIFEQVYLGQVGILPKENWVQEFFPEYPYRYQGLNEAYLLVKEFIRNPQEMKNKVEKYRKMIENEWDIDKNSEDVLQWVKKILRNYKPERRLVEIAQEVLEKAGKPKEFTFQELREMFKKYSVYGIDIKRLGYKGFNKFDWIKAVKEIGYQDTLEKELRFKRKP